MAVLVAGELTAWPGWRGWETVLYLYPRAAVKGFLEWCGCVWGSAMLGRSSFLSLALGHLEGELSAQRALGQLKEVPVTGTICSELLTMHGDWVLVECGYRSFIHESAFESL